jgi:hypothetical protein
MHESFFASLAERSKATACTTKLTRRLQPGCGRARILIARLETVRNQNHVGRLVGVIERAGRKFQGGRQRRATLGLDRVHGRDEGSPVEPGGRDEQFNVIAVNRLAMAVNHEAEARVVRQTCHELTDGTFRDVHLGLALDALGHAARGIEHDQRRGASHGRGGSLGGPGVPGRD